MDINTFATRGALHWPGLIDGAKVESLQAALAPIPLERPGLRLHNVEVVQGLLSAEGAVGRLAARLIGPGAMPVRALLFDKSPENNWAVGWHQDRVIAVKERWEIPDFGPWSVKDGVLHVAPPISLMQRMITIRLHLDPVGKDNGPLLFVSGSHRMGMVPAGEVAQVAARCGAETSLASAGDAWAYATLILHASQASVGNCRRRVLHVDYAAEMLPDGLAWLGT